MTHPLLTSRLLLRVAVALLGALVVPAIALAQAASGSRVLVMPFAADVEAQAPGGAGTSLWLGEAAAVLLTEGLANEGVGALTRQERVAAFDRLQLPMSAALTRATMIRVGELMGASDLVFGEIELGNTLNVRVRMIRLGAGSERPSVEDSATLPQIFAMFDRVSRRVADVTGRLHPRAARAATPLPPLPIEAFELYVKGLVAATPAAEQRFLENAMRIAPTDPRIQLELWNVYTAQDLHDRALQAANSIPAESSFGRRARFAVAQSLIALKRFDGALHELEVLHQTDPAAAISNAMGVVQLRRGPTEGTTPATTYFARAVREEPDNPLYRFNLGYAYALASSTAEAIAALREAVRVDPTDGDAHLVMSAVLGKTAEGQRELELARSLGASVDPASMTAGGRVPAGLERLEPELVVSPAARRSMQAIVQRDQQETAAFHLARARTLIDQRRDSEAIEALRRAIYLSPYADEPQLLLGTLYRRAGRLPEAIDAFKISIWSRETAAAQVALGGALLDSGDEEGARRAAQRALVLAPTSEPARELLKRLGS
jgi:tetratricopeptide (TPR) repeat protein